MVNRKKKGTKKTKFKSILKEVKISEEVLKPKKRKWIDDAIQTPKAKEEKESNKESKNNGIKEPIREESFHETIINEDIGFMAPVLNQNSQVSQQGLDSLETTAAEFSQPIPIKSENIINYAANKAAGDYSGSGDYALGDQLRYSVDSQGLTLMGMGLDKPLGLDKPRKSSSIFNPFSEERGKRADSNWATQASELEEFTKMQQKEEFEKEKKKRHSSQFA
jgi:hypothetical protein